MSSAHHEYYNLALYNMIPLAIKTDNKSTDKGVKWK